MAMSDIDSKASATDQIMFNCEDETVTVVGKPCIDFQPDDRWQIKDDEPSEKMKQNSRIKVVNSSNGSARKLRSRSKSNEPALNGEATSLSSDDEHKEKNEGLSDNKSKLPVNLTNECNNNKRTLRRRVSPRGESNAQDAEQGKKAKVEVSELNDSEKKNVDEDSVDKLSMPHLSPAANDCNKETKDKNLEDCIEVLENDSEKSSDNNTNESSKSSEINKHESESLPKLEEFSLSDTKNIKPESDNSNTEQKCEPELVLIKSDIEKSELDASSSNETKNSEIEVINIVDETKKSSDNSEEEESDSEIQILNSEDSPKTTQPDFPAGGDFQGDFKLSAGYPYFNSLKEKIKGFKAGDYKPVKFPHTGTLLLAENEVIIESPSLLVPLLIKESDQFPPESKGKTVNGDDTTAVKPTMISKRNFFQSSVGQFLINLGMSRVQEFYQGDMKRLKQKQLRKSPNDTTIDEAVKTHEKRQIELKEINAVFNFRAKRCQFCNFKSESRAVMEGHYLTPHISSRREYKCNFCAFMTRDPKEIMFHFDAMHGKKAIVEFNVPFHECIFCSFQSHLKTKVNAHMNRCRKHFIPSQNLSPPFDFEFPGVTTKPVTIADVIAHRRLLLSSAKNQRLPLPDDNSPHGAYARKKLASVLSKLSGQGSFPDLKNPNLMKQLMASQTQQLTALTAAGIQLPPGIVITRPRFQPQQMRPVGRFPQPRAITGTIRCPPRRGTIYPSNMTSTSQLTSSGISITPVTRPGGSVAPRTNSAQSLKNVTLTPISSATNRNVSQKPGPPQPVALFSNIAGSNPSLIGQPPARMPASAVRPARPSTPYQRLNTPPSQLVKGSSGNTFVMCEICDSYIKDLEELRSHMNWVHKVKIHPKMLVSRPPLNCQKCQWRFFTDQGLERHLLGAHGLVTTNMQEMANKNQDGGRCIICGAVFTYKLVSHMTQVHKVTLKPAHLSYKCTVCTATFTLYRLFESHVYNVHSGSAKRPAEEPPASDPPAKKVRESSEETGPRKCKECGLVTENLHDHLISKHMKKCSVKLCQILQCEKCLYSSGEMLVIRMEDVGLVDSADSSDESSSGEEDSGEDDEDSVNLAERVQKAFPSNSSNTTEEGPVKSEESAAKT